MATNAKNPKTLSKSQKIGKHSAKHTIVLTNELWEELRKQSIDLDMPVSHIIEIDLRKLNRIMRLLEKIELKGAIKGEFK